MTRPAIAVVLSGFPRYSETFALEEVTALERDGWDGDWYRRGYYDDGTPLGSYTSDECRIDSIAQSWACFPALRIQRVHCARWPR